MGKLVLKYESSCLNCGKENTMVDYDGNCASCQACDGVCSGCIDVNCDNNPAFIDVEYADNNWLTCLDYHPEHCSGVECTNCNK